MPDNSQNHLNLAASLCIVAFGWVPQIVVMIAAGARSESPSWPLPLILAFLVATTSASGLIFAAIFAKREKFVRAGLFTLGALSVQAGLSLLTVDLLAVSYGPGKILLACRLFQLSGLLAAIGVVAILIIGMRENWKKIRPERKIALFILPAVLIVGIGVVVASESTTSEVSNCTVLASNIEEHDYTRKRRGTYEVRAVFTTCGDYVVNGDLTTGRLWHDLVWEQLEVGKTYDFTLSGMGIQRFNIVEVREVG